jgi:aspartyl-tRNA(Asn)/glutamyl-tRNA(Gln) amidotransferase subunit A
MAHVMDQTLPAVVAALREGRISSSELTEEAIRRHEDRGSGLHAYKLFDAAGARAAAARADATLAGGGKLPPLCGIPVSVKDLYGVEGMPTYAGTVRQLPAPWSRDAWLVARLREQGAVFMGKTHTVELALGATGFNPNWETPRNPWDPSVHRIPGGSSSGAGPSLWEGSALIALGSDTGGSIRIPASLTGHVGHRTTKGRWPTQGVVPLSHTMDTVGALTRSVEDAVWFFGAVDPAWGDPDALGRQVAARAAGELRVAVLRCAIWDDCQEDVAEALRRALGELKACGWRLSEVDGELLDLAGTLYATGGIAGNECATFLERDLPGWRSLVHPIVGQRIDAAVAKPPAAYPRALAEMARLAASAPGLFRHADVLALPTAIITPPPLAGLDDPERYGRVNAALLRPTSPASVLGLCAVTLPVGIDAAGMPVGLQLVAPGGQDEMVLAAALAAERALGGAGVRLHREA